MRQPWSPPRISASNAGAVERLLEQQAATFMLGRPTVSTTAAGIDVVYQDGSRMLAVVVQPDIPRHPAGSPVDLEPGHTWQPFAGDVVGHVDDTTGAIDAQAVTADNLSLLVTASHLPSRSAYGAPSSALSTAARLARQVRTLLRR